MPKNQSIWFTVIVAAVVFLGSLTSPFFGYLAGLTGLLVIIFAAITDSFWPTRRKPESAILFDLFWGVRLGGVAPMILNVFLEGGVAAVYEMLLS